MPLDRIVLIIVCVVAAAGGTILLATVIASAFSAPHLGWMAVIPSALVAYIIFRVIAERLGNDEDDYYDRIEK